MGWVELSWNHYTFIVQIDFIVISAELVRVSCCHKTFLQTFDLRTIFLHSLPTLSLSHNFFLSAVFNVSLFSFPWRTNIHHSKMSLQIFITGDKFVQWLIFSFESVHLCERWSLFFLSSVSFFSFPYFIFKLRFIYLPDIMGIIIIQR